MRIVLHLLQRRTIFSTSMVEEMVRPCESGAKARVSLNDQRSLTAESERSLGAVAVARKRPSSAESSTHGRNRPMQSTWRVRCATDSGLDRAHGPRRADALWTFTFDFGGTTHTRDTPDASRPFGLPREGGQSRARVCRAHTVLPYCVSASCSWPDQSQLFSAMG